MDLSFHINPSKLDTELDGVRTGLEAYVGGEDCGLVKLNVEVRGDGVVPYGCALLKLYLGARQNALFDGLDTGHEVEARGD